MDFIFDPGLVLYLPLHQLDGSSFMSRDAYGHLATVTGALWTPRGRGFDGVDDHINLGNPVALNFGAGSFSIEFWIKGITATTNRGIVSKWAVDNAGYTVFTESGAARLYIREGVNTAYVIGSTNIENEYWHHVTGVIERQSQQLVLYVNGNIDVNPVDCSSIGSLNNSLNCRIGAWADLTPGRFFPGSIGETRIYNRALTPLEIQHNYLATRRRYR